MISSFGHALSADLFVFADDAGDFAGCKHGSGFGGMIVVRLGGGSDGAGFGKDGSDFSN